MAVNRTLLERIRDPDPPRARELHVSRQVIYDSILTNLSNVLNTTQGNTLTDENYGLPHLSAIRSTMPHSLGNYEAAIRRTIEKNEPRLTGVRVRHVQSEERKYELRFEISGQMILSDGKQPVRFETLADDDGRMQLK